MKVVCDIEANGLRPDKIWCIVCKDIEDGSIYRFDKVWQDPSDFQAFAANVQRWVGHNFLGYDIKWLNQLALVTPIDPTQVLDTLVLSRLVNFGRPGGHGLESWGVEFGVLKPAQEQWDVYEDKMLYRCEQDVEINYRLYKKFEKYIESPKWQMALKIEHGTADYCRRLHETGFPFDIDAATQLFHDWTKEKDELTLEFQSIWPPKYELIRDISPALTKSGRLHSKDFRWYDGDPNEVFSAGAPFSLVQPVPFNPGSKQQCIDRLHEAAWKPYNKTSGYKDYLRKPKRERDPDRLAYFERYGWTLDELNLATIPDTAPQAAKKLVRWLELNGKLNQIKGWIDAFNSRTGRIHGSFMSIGAWSGRAAHSNPNMANASSDHVVRCLWTNSPGLVLVGTDADQIQLRVLAHYMNDAKFTEALEKGDKKLGTDVHTLNSKALGDICLRDRPGRPVDKGPRDDAKTFIYAWLLGAQPPKVAEIFECTTREASDAVDSFVAAYPGLRILKSSRIPEDARRGYFEGLDGRFVRQAEERLILAGYLQNGESIVMKLARAFWEDELRRRGIYYEVVNWVHDEWQTLCREEDAELVGKIQCEALLKAGRTLKMNLSTPGETKIGRNWAETH